MLVTLWGETSQLSSGPFFLLHDQTLPKQLEVTDGEDVVGAHMAKVDLAIWVILKGYSGVNLIHGLTHRETVLDSLSRDQVCRLLANVVLASSETIPECSRVLQLNDGHHCGTLLHRVSPQQGRPLRGWVSFIFSDKSGNYIKCLMPWNTCREPVCTVAEVRCCSKHYLWLFDAGFIFGTIYCNVMLSCGRFWGC